MKQLRLPIFNSKIKYYNLRIVPSEDVFNKVTELKKEFESIFGKQPLSKSKPHITIAAFKMNSKHQESLVQVFNSLSQRQTFTLNIEGFDVFENSKTLYLKVSKSKALEDIHQTVALLYNDGLKGKLRSFVISTDPHMTISRTTGKKMLYESLQHFQKKNYSKQLDVGHLTLVSRSKYRTWDWEHVIPLS